MCCLDNQNEMTSFHVRLQTLLIFKKNITIRGENPLHQEQGSPSHGGCRPHALDLPLIGGVGPMQKVHGHTPLEGENPAPCAAEITPPKLRI